MSDDAAPKTAVEQQQAITDEVAAPKTAAEQEKEQAVKDFSKDKATGQLTMGVLVRSPFKEYFDGVAFSVTAENATGPFDVLPGHHNFIALLSPCELVIRSTEKEETKINISGGIMHVKADKIIIFLDI